MTALYIIGGILLFFFAIGMLHAEAVICYSDEFALTLRIWGIPINIVPGKKKKLSLSHYSKRAMKKRGEKAEKKAAAKAAKAEKKKRKKEAKKQKEAEHPSEKKKKSPQDILNIIELITALLKAFMARFGKHLRIRIARLHIAVGAGDAATAAILYGCVSQGACYLAHLLDTAGTLKNGRKADVDIHADYLSEKITADIEIGVSLFVWQVFDMIFCAGGAGIRTLIKQLRNK